MSRWLRFSSNIDSEINAQCEQLVDILLDRRSRKYYAIKDLSSIKAFEGMLIQKVLRAEFKVSDKVKDYIKTYIDNPDIDIKEIFNVWKRLRDAFVNGRDDKLLEKLADKLINLLPQIKDESFRNEVETELHKAYDF